MNGLFALCTRLGLKKIYARFVDETETAAMEAAASVEVSEPVGEETELEKLLDAEEVALSPAVMDGAPRFFAAAADADLRRSTARGKTNARCSASGRSAESCCSAATAKS